MRPKEKVPPPYNRKPKNNENIREGVPRELRNNRSGKHDSSQKHYESLFCWLSLVVVFIAGFWSGTICYTFPLASMFNPCISWNPESPPVTVVSDDIPPEAKVKRHIQNERNGRRKPKPKVGTANTICWITGIYPAPLMLYLINYSFRDRYVALAITSTWYGRSVLSKSILMWHTVLACQIYNLPMDACRP